MQNSKCLSFFWDLLQISVAGRWCRGLHKKLVSDVNTHTSSYYSLVGMLLVNPITLLEGLTLTILTTETNHSSHAERTLQIFLAVMQLIYNPLGYHLVFHKTS